MIVLVLVAVLWIAVLTPGILSKLAERRSARSIDHFHQQLNLLERTGPKLVVPAYRLMAPEGTSLDAMPTIVPTAPPPIRPSLVLVRAADAPNPVARTSPLGENRHEAPVLPLRAVPSGLLGPSVRTPQSRAVAGKQPAQRRRRDVFGLLCLLFVVSGALGFVHPLRGAWVFSGVCFALLVAFIGLAVYGQQIETERKHLRHVAARNDGPVGSPPISYLSSATEEEVPSERPWSRPMAAGLEG